MNAILNTKLVHSLLKTLPDYSDFAQEKNGVIDGVFRYKTLKDIEYELYNYIQNKHEFTSLRQYPIDYNYLLRLI